MKGEADNACLVSMHVYKHLAFKELIDCCTVDTVHFAGKAIVLNAKMHAIVSKISAYWPYQSLATFVAKLVHIMPQLTNK